MTSSVEIRSGKKKYISIPIQLLESAENRDFWSLQESYNRRFENTVTSKVTTRCWGYKLNAVF